MERGIACIKHSIPSTVDRAKWEKKPSGAVKTTFHSNKCNEVFESKLEERMAVASTKRNHFTWLLN